MKKVKTFIKRWPEVIALPVVFAVFLLFTPEILFQIDETAIPLDAGVLVTYVMAIMGVLMFSALAFVGIKLNWFGLFDEYLNFKNLLTQLTPWQKIITLLVVYFGFLYAFVLSLQHL